MSCATLDLPKLTQHFDYGAVTLFRLTFQKCSSMRCDITLGSEPLPYYYDRFGLLRFRSPLLPQSFVYFLFLQVLRCFSSLGSLRKTMDSSYDTTALPVVSSLIRKSADHSLCATPRSLSQLVTSFFGA